MVRPPVNKLVYLRVLDSGVGARRLLGRIDMSTISCVPTVDKVTTQGGGEMLEYEPYRVFRLKT